MKPRIKHWLGLLLVVVSVASLILCAAGLVGLWSTRSTIVTTITDTATSFNDTLSTTDEALTVAQNTLGAVHLSFASLIGTIQSIATALHDGQSAVQSVVRLAQQDLPATVDAAHTAINSAAQTAKSIDELLNQLAKFPLINLDYQPQQPLADSVTGIGATLNDLPAKLQDIGHNLDTINGDLSAVAGQVDGLGATIKQIDTNLSSVRGVLHAYQTQSARARPALESIMTGAERIITIGWVVLTFVLSWIMAAQLITLNLGLRWWQMKREA